MSRLGLVRVREFDVVGAPQKQDLKLSFHNFC